MVAPTAVVRHRGPTEVPDWLRRITERIAEWDQDVVAYIVLTVAFSAALPYFLYVAFLAMFLDHRPGILEFAGAGQLWIINIGVLSAIAVDLFRPNRRHLRHPNAYLFILVAVVSLLIISILPWGWVSLAALASEPRFGTGEKVVALSGAPAAMVAIFIGYVSIKTLNQP